MLSYKGILIFFYFWSFFLKLFNVWKYNMIWNSFAIVVYFTLADLYDIRNKKFLEKNSKLEKVLKTANLSSSLFKKWKSCLAGGIGAFRGMPWLLGGC